MTARTAYGSCRVDVRGHEVSLVLISPHGGEVVYETWFSAPGRAESLARMVLRGEVETHPVAS